MQYVEEKALREQFWKKYGYRKNIIAYQFECPARHGGIDLLTVEKVKDDTGYHIEFVAFEFKLNDIEKALSQANLNSEICHKSFIVIPDNKRKTVEERYMSQLSKYRNIGCISVAYEGNWNLFHKPKTKNDSEIKLSQEIIKVCCNII